MPVTPEFDPCEEELTDQVIADIFKEIAAEKEMHGPLPDDLIHCTAIIAEEAGEACRAAIQLKYEAKNFHSLRKKCGKNLYDEACQTAAMAISLMLKLKTEVL